jgi:hypothetical protein
MNTTAGVNVLPLSITSQLPIYHGHTIGLSIIDYTRAQDVFFSIFMENLLQDI